MRHTITFELDELLVARLEQISTKQGLTRDEYLRAVVGRQLSVEYLAPEPLPHTPALDPADPTGPFIKMMINMAAMMGQLNCSNCTQRLSLQDVQHGFCSHCEAPIPGMSTPEGPS